MNSHYLEVTGLMKHYPIRTDFLARLTGKTVVLKAVDGIDFYVKRGETWGLWVRVDVANRRRRNWSRGFSSRRPDRPIYEGRNIFTLTPAELHKLRKSRTVCLPGPLQLAESS